MLIFICKERLKKVFRMGIQGFIEKPFTTKTIEESLSRLLEEHEQKQKLKHSE